MAKLAKSAEIRSKQSDDRPLHKVYVDGEPFPYYIAIGGVSVKPSEQMATMNEITVTFIVDGPVTMTVVDRDGQL